MVGISEIRRLNLINILKELKNSHGLERADFAELAGLGYNQMNQWLSPSVNKNIGNKSAKAITTAIGVPDGWIDQLRNEYEIKQSISKHISATKTVVDNEDQVLNSPSKPYILNMHSFKMIPILKKILLYRGNLVEIVENKKISHQVEVASSIEQPLVFEISGSGYNKPYIDGYLIICDASRAALERDDVIIIRKDGNISIGEFIHDLPEKIEINNLDGFRETLDKSYISQVYTVVAYYTPHQKIDL